MLVMCRVEVSWLKERSRAVMLAAAEDSEEDSLWTHLSLASHSPRPCRQGGGERQTGVSRTADGDKS